MSRLDKEREQKLQPERMQYVKKILIELEYRIESETKTALTFIFKGEIVTVFPYSGWHTGKSIIDGRGIKELVKQINHGK